MKRKKTMTVTVKTTVLVPARTRVKLKPRANLTPKAEMTVLSTGTTKTRRQLVRGVHDDDDEDNNNNNNNHHKLEAVREEEQATPASIRVGVLPLVPLRPDEAGERNDPTPSHLISVHSTLLHCFLLRLPPFCSREKHQSHSYSRETRNSNTCNQN